jgi:hypothetical protein
LFAEEVRRRLAERERPEPTPPRFPFFSGVYTFPWYPRSLPYWLALSLAFLTVGGTLCLMMEFGHGLFGW